MALGAFSSVLRFLATLLSLYSLLLIVHIFLTWFDREFWGKPGAVIEALTEPYLELIRRLGWTRVGMFDFSAVVGILLINVAVQVLRSLAARGIVTLGFLLSVLIGALGDLFLFVLFVFLLLLVVRLILTFFPRATSHPIWSFVDSFVAITLRLTLGPFFRRMPSYRWELGVVAGVLFFARYALDWGLLYARGFLASLPF